MPSKNAMNLFAKPKPKKKIKQSTKEVLNSIPKKKIPRLLLENGTSFYYKYKSFYNLVKIDTEKMLTDKKVIYFFYKNKPHFIYTDIPFTKRDRKLLMLDQILPKPKMVLQKPIKNPLVILISNDIPFYYQYESEYNIDKLDNIGEIIEEANKKELKRGHLTAFYHVNDPFQLFTTIPFSKKEIELLKLTQILPKRKLIPIPSEQEKSKTTKPISKPKKKVTKPKKKAKITTLDFAKKPKKDIKKKEYPFKYGSRKRPLGVWVKGSFGSNINFQLTHNKFPIDPKEIYYSFLLTDKALSIKEMNKLELEQIKPKMSISPNEIEKSYHALDDIKIAKYMINNRQKDSNRQDIWNIMKDIDEDRFRCMSRKDLNKSMEKYFDWLEKEIKEREKEGKRSEPPNMRKEIKEAHEKINAIDELHKKYEITNSSKYDHAKANLRAIEFGNVYSADLMKSIFDDLQKELETAWKIQKHYKKDEQKEIIAKRQEEKKQKLLTKQERQFVELALKEMFPDVKYDWWINEKIRNYEQDEIYIRFKTGSIRHWKKKIIEKGKELSTNPPPKPRLVQALINDIPEQLSISAYSGTSHTPQDRGISTRANYVEFLNEFHDYMYANVPKDNHKELKEELLQFKEKYKSKFTEQLSRHASIVSSMIAGPAKFPVRQMNKRGDVYQRKQMEFMEWTRKVLKAIKKKFGLIKSGIISSDDEDAITKLNKKIEYLTKKQNNMKATNKIVKSRSKKKTKAIKIKELIELGWTEDNVHRLFKPDFAGRIGFPSFELQNNNANIRRLKARVEKLTLQRSQKTESNEIHGVEMIDNVEDNRFQLFFPDKPNEKIRKMLKSNGFRWTPSKGAWQSYRNAVAKPRALKILEAYEEENK